MTVRTVRLPDVGEGIAEAELVSWLVSVGDAVTSDTVIAEVLTDKATVEIYAPVAGTVAFVHGAPGDVLAVGSDFFGIDVGGAAVTDEEPPPAATDVADVPDAPDGSDEPDEPDEPAPPVASTAPATSIDSPPVAPPALSPDDEPDENEEPPDTRRSAVTAAPAVRERARTLGIDLGRVAPSGPDGRVTHADLDRHITSRGSLRPSEASNSTEQVTLIGLRRRIATRMTTAWRIPHITYVDEIDMTQLEHLRGSLATAHPERPRVTVLPFVMRAIVIAVGEQPNLNATFDDEAQPQVLTTHAAVHIGIATQTPNGLIVPVVRDAQALDLWEAADELARVTTAARDGTMTRDESTGSTITITSLGAMGGVATTPIINHPEVAIVGINKMQTRPVWDGGTFAPRTMMNMSSSFDHRVIDGWDAATFIQRIKTLLEEPALLFV